MYHSQHRSNHTWLCFNPPENTTDWMGSGKSLRAPSDGHSMAVLQGNSTGHIYHHGLGEATSPSAVTYVPFQWGKLDSLCLRRLCRYRSHWSCPAPQEGDVQQHAGWPSSRAGAPWPLADAAVQHSVQLSSG